MEGLDANDRPVSVIHADIADLRLLAVFDVLINNADRKAATFSQRREGVWS